ncbi:Uncharacterised protein [Mycobacteroides abscessus subsp. abscessus]|nr:Uncharacterised protein [Mycobacteroides abscessus subsp. abscessus]
MILLSSSCIGLSVSPLDAATSAVDASVIACSYRSRTLCGSVPAMKAVVAAASATDSVLYSCPAE